MSKLRRADEFINWRRGVRAHLQQKDNELLGNTDRSNKASVAQQRHWVEANVKAKSKITLTLAKKPLAQVSAIVDNDKRTFKYLWYEFVKNERLYNTKMAINLQRNLEMRRYRLTTTKIESST